MDDEANAEDADESVDVRMVMSPSSLPPPPGAGDMQFFTVRMISFASSLFMRDGYAAVLAVLCASMGIAGQDS